MEKDEKYPDWQYKPYRLTRAEMENPAEVIKAFFESYPLPASRDLLRELAKMAFAGNTSEFLDGNDVGELFLFNDRLEIFMEAGYLMGEQGNKTG